MTGAPRSAAARRIGSFATVLMVVLTVAACGGAFPRDTDGNLDRITGGALRVGVSENPHWTEVLDDGRVTGREVDLVTDFAAKRKTWR